MLRQVRSCLEHGNQVHVPLHILKNRFECIPIDSSLCIKSTQEHNVSLFVNVCVNKKSLFLKQIIGFLFDGFSNSVFWYMFDMYTCNYKVHA